MSRLQTLLDAAKKATPGRRVRVGNRLTGLLKVAATGTIICDPYGPNPQDEDFFVEAEPSYILALGEVVKAARDAVADKPHRDPNCEADVYADDCDCVLPDKPEPQTCQRCGGSRQIWSATLRGGDYAIACQPATAPAKQLCDRLRRLADMSGEADRG